MGIQYRPLTDKLGRQADGVDLRQVLSEADFETLEHEFNLHGVMVIRGQKLDPQQHVALSRRFGELEVHVLTQYLLPGTPEILVISNIREDGKPIGVSDAGQYWHTDLSYMKSPSRCSLLYAREIPAPDGDVTYGDTCFVNTAAAYGDLPSELKESLEGKTARHAYERRYAALAKNNAGNRPELTADQVSKVPEVIHPVIRTHPVTGRKSIYVNEGFTVEILGVPASESDALLKMLCAHCTQEKYMYRHQWSVGDLLLWDNCTVQHLAVADYTPAQPRKMHRTTVAGSPVF